MTTTKSPRRVAESFHAHAYAVTSRAMPVLAAVIEASMREGFHFDRFDHPRVAGAAGLVRVYADPILAVQEPGESRVMGEAVDRLGQYFPPFDREEFMRDCEEAPG